MRSHTLLLVLSPVCLFLGFQRFFPTSEWEAQRVCGAVASAALIWSYTFVQIAYGPLGPVGRVLFFISGPLVMLLSCIEYGSWTWWLMYQMYAGAIVGTSLILCAGLLQAAAVRARMTSRLRCRHCGYDLTGHLSEVRCSECGGTQ